MVAINFYFQVHQPFRLRHYRVFDIGKDHEYFDNKKNIEIIEKVSKKNYLPMNNILLELIHKYDAKFSFSLSGVILEQFEKYCPRCIESFKDLVDTGNVEIFEETYYHSLASLFSVKEFKEQIKLHNKKVKELFNYRPKIFRNTELIYYNELAKIIDELGYKGIIAEGVDRLLGWRSPNFLYRAKDSNIKLLLKNYKLSDDIAFRFSNRHWKEWPLTAEKYAQWINAINGNGDVINLFMDYETFGEHQWPETGIFNFMKKLPEELLKHPDNYFITSSEAVKRFEARDVYDVPYAISWADVERDLTAWLGNNMQINSIKEIYNLEKDVKRLKNKEPKLLDDWRKLQTSDHFYYMCTKWFADGDVHKYFNPYDNPYDAYLCFMNVLTDIKYRIKDIKSKNKSNKVSKQKTNLQKSSLNLEQNKLKLED